MDSSHIWTIIITAVVSVVAKELIQWLLSLLKRLTFPARVKERVRLFLSRPVLGVLVDLLFIVIFIAAIGVNFLSSEPATKRDIAYVGTLVLLVALMFFVLLVDLVKLAIFLGKNERAKKEDEA